MYTIGIMPKENQDNHDKLSTATMLGTMLDVMEQVRDYDDATFVLRMKLTNNIEFLVDQLMEEYARNK